MRRCISPEMLTLFDDRSDSSIGVSATTMNRLAERADLEGDIDGDVQAGVDQDAGLLNAKSLRAPRRDVFAGQHVLQAIVARVVGGGGDGCRRLRALRADRDTRQDTTLFVFDGAANTSFSGYLRGRRQVIAIRAARTKLGILLIIFLLTRALRNEFLSTRGRAGSRCWILHLGNRGEIRCMPIYSRKIRVKLSRRRLFVAHHDRFRHSCSATSRFPAHWIDQRAEFELVDSNSGLNSSLNVLCGWPRQCGRKPIDDCAPLPTGTRAAATRPR